MQKLFDGCERVMLYISTMATLVIMLLTTADAGGRYLFNWPIMGAYDVTTNYLMILAVFLALNYGYRNGSYIRVTFLVERLPGKVRLIVNHLSQVASMLYCILLVLATYKQALLTIDTHAVLGSLDFIPIGPSYVIVSVGLFVLSLGMLLDIRKVRKGESPLFKGESPIV